MFFANPGYLQLLNIHPQISPFRGSAPQLNHEVSLFRLFWWSCTNIFSRILAPPTHHHLEMPHQSELVIGRFLTWSTNQRGDRWRMFRVRIRENLVHFLPTGDSYMLIMISILSIVVLSPGPAVPPSPYHPWLSNPTPPSPSPTIRDQAGSWSGGRQSGTCSSLKVHFSEIIWWLWKT